MTKPLVSYAQNREDLILYVLLHKFPTGFYVDVGANDPVIDSVTRFFYERGWHGINIEPIPEIYAAIAKNRHRDTNLNVAVSNQPGQLKLREYGAGRHGWSTVSSSVIESHQEIKDYVDYPVAVQTLSAIFDENKVPDIDFLKVDVEGFEYEVLSGNDWEKYRPKVVVVEDNSSKRWTAVLQIAGYDQVHHDGLNRYFVRHDLRYVCTMDDYVSVLLGGVPQSTAREENTVKRLKLTDKWLTETQHELVKSRDREERLSSELRAVKDAPEDAFSIKVLAQALRRRVMRRLRNYR